MANFCFTSIVLAATALALASCYSPDDVAALVAATTDASSGGSETGDEPALPEFDPIHGVDILFIVDDSQTMARVQGLVAQAGTALADSLAGVDLRIGFTTTDVGNPRCAAQARAPEDGALVRFSCREDPGHFVGDDGDHWDEACGLCPLRDDELGWVPTTTALDPVPAPRPWIQRAADGTSNFDPVIDLAQAFACAAPLGIDGCGYESPLEGMRRALTRARTPGDVNYGFVRDHSILAIVIVSDETDCSAQDTSIFLDGSAFWDPVDALPTSAVCWRAGVACTGPGPAFARCDAENHDVAGAPAAGDADAVLIPVATYIEFLNGLLAERSAGNPAQQLVMRLLSGVPDGYGLGSVDTPYVAAPEESVALFGIGPGCTADDARTGVPPVREREVAEAFQAGPVRNIHSICAAAYDDMFAGLAAEVRAFEGRVCVPQCVADRYPATPEREPACVFTRADGDADDPLALIPACGDDGDGGHLVPDGYEHCHVVHTDRTGATVEPGDDISDGCRKQGYNLEVSLVARTPGAALPRVRVDCGDSTEPMNDCPLLAPAESGGSR